MDRVNFIIREYTEKAFHNSSRSKLIFVSSRGSINKEDSIQSNTKEKKKVERKDKDNEEMDLEKDDVSAEAIKRGEGDEEEKEKEKVVEEEVKE